MRRHRPTQRRVFLAALFVLSLSGCKQRPQVAIQPASQPEPNHAPARPTTQPASRPQARPRSYMDLVLAAAPDVPATQPLGMPLELPEAAHLVFSNPIYLSPPPRPMLWISDPDGPTAEVALRNLVNPKLDLQAHVLREAVVFL